MLDIAPNFAGEFIRFTDLFSHAINGLGDILIFTRNDIKHWQHWIQYCIASWANCSWHAAFWAGESTCRELRIDKTLLMTHDP